MANQSYSRSWGSKTKSHAPHEGVRFGNRSSQCVQSLDLYAFVRNLTRIRGADEESLDFREVGSMVESVTVESRSRSAESSSQSVGSVVGLIPAVSASLKCDEPPETRSFNFRPFEPVSPVPGVDRD